MTWAFEYPDEATLGRVAVAGLARLVGLEREEPLKAAITAGLAPYRRADSSDDVSKSATCSSAPRARSWLNDGGTRARVA